ncbi:MAG: hypothetical protein ABUS48_06245 [Pseudomonadota bacterium]
MSEASSPDGETSPEQMAYLLLLHIAQMEKRAIRTADTGEATDRKWLLDTFAECLNAVRNPAGRISQNTQSRADMR